MSSVPASKSSTASNSPSAQDAIQLLKADHREVEEMFEKFDKARTSASKRKIADEICKALTVHSQIEEELFYPACEKAGVEQDLLDEATVEHQGVKTLISQIVDGSPEDGLWEAKVTVLKENVEHHVKEEEARDGIFAQARKSGVDLDTLGEAMAARKAQLTR